MIDDPGSFSGKLSSPSPHLGPEAKNLMSFAIFIIEHASTLRAPETSTIASCEARASNLFGAVTNGISKINNWCFQSLFIINQINIFPI